MNYVINTLKKGATISKDIYGHFSEHLGRCIYEGLFVGDSDTIPNINGMRCDVVEALKAINIPVLRWPGGCFADEYHWEDGVGPKENRKKMINSHWGGLVEDNSFGTNEFFELCEQLGCDAYVNGNLGSGTVKEMQEWVEYITFEGTSPMAVKRAENGHPDPWKMKYFAIGNENWGCGGNMTPEYYSNEYRRYQTYVRNYGENRIYKIACGANVDDYNWTEGVMKGAAGYIDGLSLHHYTIPKNWQEKGSATKFTAEEWYITLNRTLYMSEIIERHLEIMNKYDPKKRVDMIVDEWGTWFDCEPGTNPGFLYQQNTIRDALVAGINLNLFNKHADRIKMTNIAQIANVLQSLILTEGASMVLTPTYHIFDIYKEHMECELIDSHIVTETIGMGKWTMPNISESVSRDKDGNLTITLCNLSLDKDYEIDSTIIGEEKYSTISGTIVTGKMDDYNDFDNKNKVSKKEFGSAELTDIGFKLTLPKASVVALKIGR